MAVVATLARAWIPLSGDGSYAKIMASFVWAMLAATNIGTSGIRTVEQCVELVSLVNDVNANIAV